MKTKVYSVVTFILTTILILLLAETTVFAQLRNFDTEYSQLFANQPEDLATEEETEETVETGNSYDFVAVGAKGGLLVSNMFTDEGVLQLTEYYEQRNFSNTFKIHSTYGIQSYITFYPMFQLQVEIYMQQFKGMRYEAIVQEVGYVHPEDAPPQQPKQFDLDLTYMSIPILFRFEPDFLAWTGTRHLDFYLLVGPTINILIDKAETKLRVCETEDCTGENDPLEKPDEFFTEHVKPYDFGVTIALGYTIKDVIPVVDPFFEFRAEFGFIDMSHVYIPHGGGDSYALNYSIYVLFGINWGIFEGSIF